MKSLKTFYDTLQVPRTATIAALRTAHKALTAQLQPEHHPQDPGAAAQQLLLVNKALEVLTHPDARQAYDAWLNERVGASDVPTLPDLVEPPSPAGASTKVSSEVLEPLPTLDLDGFAAEVAAKAKAKARTPAPPVPPATPGTSGTAPARMSVPVPVPAAAPSSPSGFAETQPYHPSDLDDLPDLEAPARSAAAAATAAATPSTTPGAKPNAVARQSPALAALDWLRERPIALVAAILACVLLVAFAPWLWHASVGAFKPEVPAAAPLQPTYVEPPLEAVSAPAAAAEPAEPLEPVDAVQEPAAQQPTASKPAQKAKPRKVVKRVAEPRRAQEAAAPVQQPEPVAAPVPVDTGGHSGFAPKCRWVTPTNWSCK